MVSSIPLLFCESSVSMKGNQDRKKNLSHVILGLEGEGFDGIFEWPFFSDSISQ